jgi:hypothetical protein
VGHIAMDIEIINELKQRLTGQSIVLDIGFGAGRISFDILGELTIRKIIGIESRKKEEVNRDYNTFLGPDNDKGIYGLRKSDGTIDIFDYYKYRVSEQNEPMDLESFNEIVNINFDRTFKDFVKENRNYFDLVILFNVLHYPDIGEPRWVLDQVKNILTENGLLLISFKNYKRCGDADEDGQEIDTPCMIEGLGTNFKTIISKACEMENSIIYLGERYAPQSSSCLASCN